MIFVVISHAHRPREQSYSYSSHSSSAAATSEHSKSHICVKPAFGPLDSLDY